MSKSIDRFRRLENDLVHKLELAPGGQGRHAMGTNSAAYRLVKKFSRSAAGHNISMSEVRTPRQCLNTAQYLIKEFVCKEERPMDKTRYDFVLDRLKAVRQDLSVRECRDDRAARVLRMCVRFHLYAGYRLCGMDAADFDPVTNFAQCLDCLKSLLTLRQEASSGNDREEEEEEDEHMSAVYLMLNMGSTDSIKWALKEDKAHR